MKTELIHAMPFADYLAIDAVSKSSLTNMATSPGYYKHRKVHGWKPNASTQAIIDFGSAVDCLLFDGEAAFRSQYAVKPPDHDGRTKEGRLWSKLNAGKAQVPAAVLSCVEAIKASQLAMRYLSGGEAQLSATWQDDETEFWCKCRPDYYYKTERGPVYDLAPRIVDLKTTKSADKYEFPKVAARLRYHWQAAMYCDGMTAATGIQHDDFIFVVAEREPPHRVEVYSTPLSLLEQGRDEYRGALAKLRECTDADCWPTSSGEVHELEFPRWAR